MTDFTRDTMVSNSVAVTDLQVPRNSDVSNTCPPCYYLPAESTLCLRLGTPITYCSLNARVKLCVLTPVAKTQGSTPCMSRGGGGVLLACKWLATVADA